MNLVVTTVWPEGGTNQTIYTGFANNEQISDFKNSPGFMFKHYGSGGMQIPEVTVNINSLELPENAMFMGRLKNVLRTSEFVNAALPNSTTSQWMWVPVSGCDLPAEFTYYIQEYIVPVQPIV